MAKVLCENCVCSGMCISESGQRKNCTAFIHKDKKHRQLNFGTCARLLVAVRAEDQEGMRDQVRQLLSEIHSSEQVTMARGFDKLASIIYQERYRHGGGQ